MGRLLDDHQLTERVLGHIAAGTTDESDEVWREPVANYRSPQRLEAEIKQVLRRAATPFCPSAAVPQAGCYLAREAAGTPVLVARGDDGQVRAFRNVCRHRGMSVAADAGRTRAFVCRYHGWTYALDGSLRLVPHEHGFPGLDKSCHGLTPLHAEERHGIVFVNQDGHAPPAGLDELDGLIAPGQQCYASSAIEIEANWKILLEGFIEGYHIKATHPQTFLPYGFDNLNVVERFGPHSRVVYPFQRIAKLALLPAAERRVTGYLTQVYHLFPNALVTVLSSHTNLVVLEPLTIDRTQLVTYVLTNGPGPEALEEAKRDAEFVSTTGAAEDRAVARAIQRGLAGGANEVFTFGHFEGAIQHFHRTLDAALEGGRP